MLESIGLHFIKKGIDWGLDKLKSKPDEEEGLPEPSILDQVQRFKRVISAHGMRPEHWSRFFKACDAPFTIARTDQINDEALLAWLDDDKIDWLCTTFRLNREWMDSEPNQRPHDGYCFNKDPKDFYQTITEELKRTPECKKPEAFFILDSDKKNAEHDSCVRLHLAIAIPLCRLSDEVTVYRYLFDDVGGGYPWNDLPYHRHLRVVARLCFKNFHFSMWGISIPKAEFEAIADGEALIPEILQKPGRHHCTWHPEDYGLAANESKVAKETDTLAPLLEWMASEGLPASEPKAFF